MHPFLKLIDTFDTDNRARGVQFEKLSSLQPKFTLKSPTTPIYPHRWGYGHLRGALESLKTSKPLKQGVRIVDTFAPLTVNSSAVRLVNTLADKANGADSRR